MPTNTYVALDKITVTGSAAASVTFSSISQGYTDLIVIFNGTGTSGSTNDIGLRLNGDTGTNYSNTLIYGSGSVAGSGRHTGLTFFRGWYLSSTVQTTCIFNVMNYSNTTTFKTVIGRSNISNAEVDAAVGLYRSTSAITSLSLTPQGGASFTVGSTFSLYGISAIGGTTPKATGGTVTSDATYWYHAFEMSGNFVPNQTLSCDYLVLAGGGGGGYDGGGGGGAGGFRAFTSQSLTAQNYAVTVGGGGAAAASVSVKGSTGSTSTFNSASASGGGGGGSDSSATGAAGGSGGGGRQNRSPNTGGAGNAGSYSPVEGYAGGAGTAGVGGSGGGGGAGAIGSTGTTGTGGIGTSTYSSWGLVTSTGQNVSGTVYYAGGGGGNIAAGSSGGSGGGGNGSSGDTGGTGPFSTAGTQNTGGGGGGGSGQFAARFSGSSGGSGLVIVRYAK